MRAIILTAIALLAVAQAGAGTEAHLPEDVRTFLERRNSCDHWRGEEPYDAARLAEINRNACKLCMGTDKELTSLKRKYRPQKDIMDVLSPLEPKIELPSSSAMAARCKSALLPGNPASSP